jgi:prepilin-type N-terminal cleavage/methylation domain-containing protein
MPPWLPRRRAVFARRRPARGFSLIEMMVSMTILGIVLMSLARLSVYVTQSARTNDLVAKRTAALQLELNKFGAMPFTTLSTFSTTAVTVTSGDFTYTRELTVTAAGSNRLAVKIVVIPARTTVRKDSVMFDRVRSSTSPLCTGC